MKTIVIIQARMGSSRLPGKVLMPLGEFNVLHYVVERCRKMTLISDVIVATSTLTADDQIWKWCIDNKVTCFRGSEADVLDRYYQCAFQYKPDYVVRVTADCPFLDYKFGSYMIEMMNKNPSDIILLEGLLPRGLAIEIFSFSALELMNEVGTEARHREHVTYYAYEFPGRFHSITLKVPEQLCYPQFRMTLDTKEDYLLCLHLADFFKGQVDVSSSEMVAYLLNHPEVAALNAHIQQKPVI